MTQCVKIFVVEGATGATGPRGETGPPGDANVFVNRTLFVDQRFGNEDGEYQNLSMPYSDVTDIGAADTGADTDVILQFRAGTYEIPMDFFALSNITNLTIKGESLEDTTILLQSFQLGPDNLTIEGVTIRHAIDVNENITGGVDLILRMRNVRIESGITNNNTRVENSQIFLDNITTTSSSILNSSDFFDCIFERVNYNSNFGSFANLCNFTNCTFQNIIANIGGGSFAVFSTCNFSNCTFTSINLLGTGRYLFRGTSSTFINDLFIDNVNGLIGSVFSNYGNVHNVVISSISFEQTTPFTGIAFAESCSSISHLVTNGEINLPDVFGAIAGRGMSLFQNCGNISHITFGNRITTGSAASGASGGSVFYNSTENIMIATHITFRGFTTGDGGTFTGGFNTFGGDFSHGYRLSDVQVFPDALGNDNYILGHGEDHGGLFLPGKLANINIDGQASHLIRVSLDGTLVGAGPPPDTYDGKIVDITSHLYYVYVNAFETNGQGAVTVGQPEQANYTQFPTMIIPSAPPTTPLYNSTI